MSLLAELLSSRARAEVLRILFGVSGGEVHLREIVRRSGMAVGTMRSELKKLQRLDVVSVRRDGNRLYYSANAGHPLYRELHGLVLKTTGLVEILQRRLEGPGIQVAFVYGSIAQGREKAGSDVDLFVVAAGGLRALTAKLAGVAEELGREVNPFLVNPEEYRRRLQEKDHFLMRVLASPKMFVVGGGDELEAVGRYSQNRDRPMARHRPPIRRAANAVYCVLGRQDAW
jgi:predicted nucleotidyltransferase